MGRDVILLRVLHNNGEDSQLLDDSYHDDVPDGDHDDVPDGDHDADLWQPSDKQFAIVFVRNRCNF